MKTSALALAASVVACGSGAPRQQSNSTESAGRRPEPSRLTAPVVSGPIELGTLGTGKYSYTVGLNALGQVAGSSATGA